MSNILALIGDLPSRHEMVSALIGFYVRTAPYISEHKPIGPPSSAVEGCADGHAEVWMALQGGGHGTRCFSSEFSIFALCPYANEYLDQIIKNSRPSRERIGRIRLKLGEIMANGPRKIADSFDDDIPQSAFVLSAIGDMWRTQPLYSFVLHQRLANGVSVLWMCNSEDHPLQVVDFRPVANIWGIFDSMPTIAKFADTVDTDRKLFTPATSFIIPRQPELWRLQYNPDDGLLSAEKYRIKVNPIIGEDPMLAR